jgi:hypothetical protein
MACAPLVAGRLVEHVDSLKAGKVRLSLTVPRTAKGKLLKVELKVTAAASGLTARHTYVFRIR